MKFKILTAHTPEEVQEEIEKLYEWMKRTTEEMKNSSLLN